MQTSYGTKYLELIDALPANLGDLRVSTAAKSGDPLPFTLTTTQDSKITYVPRDLGDDPHKDLVRFTTLFSILAKEAGFEIRVTKRECKKAFWNTVKALTNTLEGVFYCLRRDEIAPMENIPAHLKTGWNFALWYAYSKAANDPDGGKYLKIPRITSLSSVSDTAWGSDESLADLTRLTSAMRVLSQQFSDKIGPIRKFFKNKGYFVESGVGKKPGAGLYHPEELDIATENWVNRVRRVERAYDLIPTSFSDLGPGNKAATIMSTFACPNNDLTRRIEETKMQRIPELLVLGPKQKGKTQDKTIAKGSGLPEKLINIGGGDQVRTIGKVMYTPLVVGLTRNEFVDYSIREANSRMKRQESFVARQLAAWADRDDRRDQYTQLELAQPFIVAAATVYIEVIPDRRGNAAWDGVFPPS